jgi:Ran GTPase-activating protein (RanGAP) involved in mRNA processing and transport
MRALLSLDLSKNELKSEAHSHIAAMLRVNTTLKTLNYSGNDMSLASGVQTFASGIKDNRALSKLDASANGMFGYKGETGITAWAEALKANTSITELNLAKNDIRASDAKILAPAISDNGAMTSLDLSRNYLKAGGAKIVAEAIKVTKCIPAIILASF